MFRTLPFSYSFLCSFFLFFALAFSKLWIPLLESGDSCRSRSSRSSWPIFRSFWGRGSLPLCSSRGRRFLCLLDVWRRCARRRVDFQGCEKGWKTVICVSPGPMASCNAQRKAYQHTLIGCDSFLPLLLIVCSIRHPRVCGAEKEVCPTQAVERQYL
jgi:hypothetical protein